MLLTIDGEEIEDIFDYDYYDGQRELRHGPYRKDNGEEWELEIENGLRRIWASPLRTA